MPLWAYFRLCRFATFATGRCALPLDDYGAAQSVTQGLLIHTAPLSTTVKRSK